MFWKIVIVALLILNGLLVFHLIWGENSFLTYLELKQTSTTMEEDIEQVEEANLKLSRKIRLLKNDPKYLEKVIRSELHFVQPDETLYLFSEETDLNHLHQGQ
jgi:cell division protein FtsB